MNERILVVDDDVETLKLIGLMLQRRGYEICAAQSGVEALEKAKSEEPDLVILDVMMPQMDGNETCRRLRADPETSHLPILMFTAKGLASDRVKGLEAGADDFLTKPVHPAELASRVEALLTQASAERTAQPTMIRGHVIGLLGAKGGVGTTTLAINLATILNQAIASHDSDETVTLVDLQARQGSIGLALGQSWEGGVTSLLRWTLEDLSQELVEGQIVTYTDKLRVLPTDYHPSTGAVQLSPAHADSLVNHLAAATDYLILDLGVGLDRAQQNAIAHCDKLIVVVEPEPLCLKLATALLKHLSELDLKVGKPRTVIIDRGGMGVGYTKFALESELGTSIVNPVIPSAPQIALAASEEGTPVVLLKPNSPIAKAYRRVGRQILL